MSESAHIALYELAMDTKEDNHVSNVRLQSEHYICRQNPVYSTTHPNLLTTTCQRSSLQLSAFGTGRTTTWSQYTAYARPGLFINGLKKPAKNQ
jgi:hypothetical protein